MVDKPNPRQVFVVHGRNESIRRDIFSFLRAIGLEPTEWTKAVEMAGKATPYVGEILDAMLENAQAIVVIMTPDDEARLRNDFVGTADPGYERALTPQPRQNVLFEAGLAMGRAPDRTVLVEVGQNRPISDLAGRHTVRLNNTTERRQALAMRLEGAGCHVDLGGTDWHGIGNFEINDQPQQSTVPESSPSKQEGLEDDEVRIIEYLAQDPDRPHFVNEIAGGLGISEIRATHYLDELSERDYVLRLLSLNMDTRYKLWREGRAYLVNQGLV